MKKLFLIICIITCISQFFGVAFGEGCEESSCNITDGPPEAITDYLKDLSKVINNISSAVGKETINRSPLGKIKTQSLKITNATTSFGGYFSSFDYYVAYPITNDIPYQIERDHKVLLDQNKRIINNINRTLRRGGGSIIIKDACKGVKSKNCNFNNQKAEVILSSLLKNHKKIMYLYESSVLGKNFKGELVFVSEDFEDEIIVNYGPDAVQSCSECEEGFGGSISKRISGIGLKNDDTQAAMDKWRYAWAVLTGDEETADTFLERGKIGKDFYKESIGLGEEAVFKRYLGKTGAGAKASEVALENLKRYNEKGEGKDTGGLNTSNPLNNTIRNTFGDIEEQIESFTGALVQSYENSKTKQGIPLEELRRVQTKIEITNSISSEIDRLYNDQSTFNIVEDTSATNLMSKIIEMHINLTNTIETLDRTTPISEKVCNSQGKGLGKCRYR